MKRRLNQHTAIRAAWQGELGKKRSRRSEGQGVSAANAVEEIKKVGAEMRELVEKVAERRAATHGFAMQVGMGGIFVSSAAGRRSARSRRRGGAAGGENEEPGAKRGKTGGRRG